LKIERRDGYTLEHLMLDLNGLEQVPAYLLLPNKRRERAPGLLYIHAHGDTYDIGKEELIQGRDVLAPYAPACAAKGIVTLAIDSWCFSGRQHANAGARGEADTFKEMLWRGQVLFGMMLFDEFQALTYLASRAEVDAPKLGVFGISMGATKAWWLAALDPRVRLCIDLCCLTDYDELIRIGNLSGHGIYYYVPGLRKHFEAADINALIAPRPRLSLNGRHDRLTPPEGVRKIAARLASLYAECGRQQDCHVELFDCGHEETPAMRQLVLEWFDRYLGED
jgi:dienelactone hydrolase